MKSLFFDTREARIALARQRYFEEGISPTGMVSEAVFQSWTRCHRSSQKPHDKIEFQPVSFSRSQLALQKNRTLHQAWVDEMPAMGSGLSSAHYSAILTDATGVLIGATPSAHLGQVIIPAAHRIGVNLSEEHVGTSAPGIVVRTGKQASHFEGRHRWCGVCHGAEPQRMSTPRWRDVRILLPLDCLTFPSSFPS